MFTEVKINNWNQIILYRLITTLNYSQIQHFRLILKFIQLKYNTIVPTTVLSIQYCNVIRSVDLY